MRVKTTKTVSEYMRIGIGFRPKQITGFFVHRDGSCALGALTEGIAGRVLDWGMTFDYEDVVSPVFPGLLSLTGLCPVCAAGESSTITHLNDEHKWTREQIAIWLDGLIAERSKTPEADQREEELVGV
jgi:hypothetical protein